MKSEWPAPCISKSQFDMSVRMHQSALALSDQIPHGSSGDRATIPQRGGFYRVVRLIRKVNGIEEDRGDADVSQRFKKIAILIRRIEPADSRVIAAQHKVGAAEVLPTKSREHRLPRAAVAGIGAERREQRVRDAPK